MTAKVVTIPRGREHVVFPSTRHYKYYPIIAVTSQDEFFYGVTEDGEVITDLSIFAQTHCQNSTPWIWVTNSPELLFDAMEAAFSARENYRRRLIQSKTGSTSKLRWVSFGFAGRPLHQIIDTASVLGRNRLSSNIPRKNHADLLRFAIDIREWCRENDLPVKTTLPGIAARLMRDDRFWSNGRGAVPRATNDRVRPYLPGNYSEIRYAKSHRIREVLALDHRRAYHHVAQEVKLPDPTTLFAKGYFYKPEQSPIWLLPGDEGFNRVLSQPGLVAIRGTVKPAKRTHTRPPAVEKLRERGTTAYLWTNEIPLCVKEGLHILGIVAAWTSDKSDDGIAKYAKWALEQIDQADDYRSEWLKPTLHSTYSLFAMQETDIHLGIKGKGEEWYLAGRTVDVKPMEVKLPTFIVNVSMFGTIQAEVRKRVMELTNELEDNGVRVYHIHADGIHASSDSQLPLHVAGNQQWSIGTLSNLTYIDDVSYMSDEKLCLPGRASTVYGRIRHNAGLVTSAGKANPSENGKDWRLPTDLLT